MFKNTNKKQERNHGYFLKIATLVLICQIILFSSACGTANTDSTTDSTTTPSNTTPVETTTEKQEVRKNCSFRNTIWGDSIEQVKNIEDTELIGETENNLAYKGQILGYDCSIIYNFNQNKLYSGGYVITDIYTSGGQYISAYEALKNELKKKYGDSTEDEIIKFETDSLIETAGESKALEFGYVAYRTRWETNDTDIMLGMMSENFKITIVLDYSDKNYSDETVSEGI